MLTKEGFVVKPILESKKFVLAYHPDTDGIVSVVLFTKLVSNGDFSFYGIETADRSFTARQLQEINDLRPEAIVFFDVSPRNFEQISKLKEKSKIFVIDHHFFDDELIEIVDLVLNPHRFSPDPGQYSCSRLMGEFFDLGQYEWLISGGLLGDGKKDLKPEVILSLREMTDKINIVGMAYKIDGSEKEETVEQRRLVIIDWLRKSNSPRDFLVNFNQSDLNNLYRVIRDDLENVLAGLIKQLNRDDLSFLEVRPGSGYNLIEAVLRELFSKNEKTVILYQRGNNFIDYRVLTKDPRINGAELFKGLGGGHRMAAGGRSDESFEKIRLLLEERYRRMIRR